MDFDFHSLWRGFQSAVFYYVSCAPCSARAARKSRLKQNARDRKERDALELVQPSAYRHPSPYRTNAYWAEEIRLGPGPPARRLNKKQRAARAKARAAATNETGTSTASRTGKGTPVESNQELAVDGVRGSNRPAELATGETKNWRLNQRDDEELWGDATYPGSTVSKSASLLPNDGSGSGEKFPGLPGYVERQPSKRGFRASGNPPVNDLHPAVVSNPAFSTGSNMWMLQPPPPAAIMKGHESPSNNRSRSTTASSGSRGSRHGGSSIAGGSTLGRKLSQRLVEEKMRKSEMLYPHDPRRIPSNWSTNTEALKIEAKYFEDSTSRVKMFTQSTETIVRTQDKTQANSSDSFAKSDSGVELKPLPGSKEDSEIGTMQKDFAFPQLTGRQSSARPTSSMSVPPMFLDDPSGAARLPHLISFNTRKHPRDPTSFGSTSPYGQPTTPQNFPPLGNLAASPSPADSPSPSVARNKTRLSKHRAPPPLRLDLDDDADDECEDDDGDGDEDVKDLQEDRLCDETTPRGIVINASKNSPILKFDGRRHSRHVLQPSHHNARWERRRSVDF